ncbi:SPFH domain-containing protein [Thermobifida fusca]|uniref:SPFH domain-containing protein n=1 Tax=Thermobifida fusca TaxID=2021 RepID=UPI001D0C0AB4|nr:SPFH domain-containing protein [Thermobifida fusca]
MAREAAVAVENLETQVEERLIEGASGIPVLIFSLVMMLAGAGGAIGGVVRINTLDAADVSAVALIVVGALLFLAGLFLLCGLTMIDLNQARVVQLFGRYIGTLRIDGLRWVNPLTTRKPVSTRIRNHETAVMKVNDADGSPIEIAAVVVWQVEDTARAVFEVDDFVQFVSTQTEAAVRHIANNYPYDNHEGTDRLSLRDNADEITEKLSAELAERVASAGVRIIESRLTHLAYAPEIAQAMLQRQQAGAVIVLLARRPRASALGRKRHPPIADRS